MSTTHARSKVPYALIALSLVPLLGGVFRISKLGAGSGDVADARFLHAPQPILLHIVCAAVYCLLGAFQFDDGLRGENLTWHRRAGWLVALSGLGSALSGVWMTVSYSIPGPMQGPLLYWVRVTVGLVMAASIAVALIKVTRKDVQSHRAFMIRAYALGQGAGTQVFLLGLPVAFLGREILGAPRDLLMTAAWLVNVVFAELVIRRRSQLTTVARISKMGQSPASAHPNG